MGYTSRYSGDIRIDPPLTWAEIRDSPHLPSGARCAHTCVRLILEETVQDTDEGVLTKRSAVGIEVCSEAHNHYRVLDEVNAIVSQHEANYSGYLEARGEDGDQWRISVVDRGDIDGVHVERFEPVITWPVEAEGDGLTPTQRAQVVVFGAGLRDGQPGGAA